MAVNSYLWADCPPLSAAPSDSRSGQDLSKDLCATEGLDTSITSRPAPFGNLLPSRSEDWSLGDSNPDLLNAIEALYQLS